jgi:hypothetical protein
VRPIPWMMRLCLFAAGFSLGLARCQSSASQRPVVIEVREMSGAPTGGECGCSLDDHAVQIPIKKTLASHTDPVKVAF